MTPQHVLTAAVILLAVIVIPKVYVAMAAIAGLPILVVQLVYPLPWELALAAWFGLTLVVDRLAGHSPRDAQRPVRRAAAPKVGTTKEFAHTASAAKTYKKDLPDPEGVPLANSWYIRSQNPNTDAASGPGVSCSFVEFDERGDYLDFNQHQHACGKILQLAKDGTPLILVIFVHGWRHSSESDNVVAFNEFLHRLAGSSKTARVHGVYLSWRGGILRPVIEKDQCFDDVSRYFGGEIIDRSRRAPISRLNWILESCSYFDRKSIPEHKFSGTALSRTIFACANAAKRTQPRAEVLLAGHSFGGLMLERSFQNASIGQLEAEWAWGTSEDDQRANPLPFDTVLLVNSAAPSIYAKQFQGFLTAHRGAMVASHVRGANSPLVFSLTSSADAATRVLHPLANAFAPLSPTLRRTYESDDFILLASEGAPILEIPQSYYYRHTPGHNPLLVNRFIEAVAPSSQAEDPKLFAVGDRTWHIVFPPTEPEGVQFSQYEGRKPRAWRESGGRYPDAETGYWIIRCSKEIIAGHNDIWSEAAMATYEALHRLARPVPASETPFSRSDPR